MNLLQRIARLFRPEQRGIVYAPIPPRDPALVDLFSARVNADSGVSVTERTAVSWTAIASGIRLAAETMAMLPVDIVQRGENTRTPLPNHPVARVLAFPNEECSAFEFIELMQTFMELWGNAYAQIIFDGAYRPIALWPLSPDRVTVERGPDGSLRYRVGLPNEAFGYATEAAVLPAEEVLHIRGWSRCGILGDRMAQNFRQAIGLGLATELFGALFFGQGANAGGILSHPGTLTDEAQKRLRKQQESNSGIQQAHRVRILEEGMTWQQITIDPEKAQFLGTRKFQVTEAARMLRLPPHLLYDLERSTFSNIEQQAIEFVTYSMLPRARRWETRLAMQLVGNRNFSNIQIKFNMAALLRGDTTAQTASFTAGRQGGWFSPNDIREMMDLNPRPGGDVYTDQPAGVPAAAPKVPPQGGDDVKAND